MLRLLETLRQCGEVDLRQIQRRRSILPNRYARDRKIEHLVDLAHHARNIGRLRT